MRRLTRRQKRVLRTADRMFGHDSVGAILRERCEIYERIRDKLGPDRRLIPSGDKELMQLYSRFATLDKLYDMYMEDYRNGRK